MSCTSDGTYPRRLKVGTPIELTGLKAKPELNGCSGAVIQNFDAETERCGIRLDDGTKVNVKLSNIIVVSSGLKLERALAALKVAGGKEEESDDDDDDDRSASKPPQEYLDELLAVGDARYELGQYGKAGGIYYRAYYAAMHSSNAINSPKTFPIAHKMIEAWTKSDDEHYLDMAHGMAQQTCMMPGCPPYIRQDMDELAEVMTKKGMKVTNIMDAFQGFTF